MPAMPRTALILLTVLLTAHAVLSQNAAELKTCVISSYADRNYTETLARLKDLDEHDHAAFESGNFSYLYARTAQKLGDTALASQMYGRIADTRSPLTPYALMHLSEIMRASGNTLVERLYLAEIVTLWQNSIPAQGANYRLARSAIESGDHSQAIRRLTDWQPSIGTQHSNSALSIRRDDLALLAEAYYRGGQPDKARDTAAALIASIPNAAQPDDAALSAARLLDALDGITGLSVADNMLWANIFQFNRDFAAAKLHYDAVITAEPNGTNAAAAVFQIARGYSQAADHLNALNWYERVLEQYPASPSARAALLQDAGAYARLGKPKEALKRYRQYIDTYPDADDLDRAYLNSLDISRDLGIDQDALKWAEKTIEHFQGKPAEALATFAEARIYISRGEWPEALDRLKRLRTLPDLASSQPGGTTVNEAAFLRAFCLEQLRRYPEAVDAYLAIPEGINEYYGWRATERLRSLTANDAAKGVVDQQIGYLLSSLSNSGIDTNRKNAQSLLRLTDRPEITAKALETIRISTHLMPRYNAIPTDDVALPSASPGRPAAAILSSLGIYDEAAPEFDAGGGISADALAKLYYLGDHADLNLAYIEPLWKRIAADADVELMPHDSLRRLYPAPFADSLVTFGKERGVDPRMMLSIMRQESRFQPDARSNAAARGLMQFIATTADKIARRLDRGDLTQDEMFYPPTAILFGSQYLADLDAMFPGEPVAAAASYNGGEDNVKRWLARSRSGDVDRYLPEIVYSQSKDYAARVMTNYRMYTLLYDESLHPR